MSQPAVSSAIRELEEYYGIRLFDRANRTVYLTDDGRKMLAYANSILSQLDEMHSVFHEGNGPLHVRIGLNETIAETCMDLISKNLPEDSFIQIDNNESILHLLRHNALDFGIVDDTDSDDLERIPFIRQDIVPVCKQDYLERTKLSVSELSQQPLLVRENGSGSYQNVTSLFQAHGCTMHISVQGISDLALIKLAKAGKGIIFLPEQLAKEAGLVKLELTDGILQRHYVLCALKSKYRSAGMNSVFEQLSAIGTKEMRKA
jgi:DNA-binding transcriptional LysR family regulator